MKRQSYLRLSAVYAIVLAGGLLFRPVFGADSVVDLPAGSAVGQTLGQPVIEPAAVAPAEVIGVNFLAETVLRSDIGVKAVLIDPTASSVYSINLENMNIYEFSRNLRGLGRKLQFIPSRGTGFNYKTKHKIKSFQEKPVEAHITHQGRYLWTSLHNAGGVVVWDLLEGDTAIPGQPYKEAVLSTRLPFVGPLESAPWMQRKIRCLWIKTGATPKVITSTPDGKLLFVANWHSGTVTMIDISGSAPETWKIVKQLGHFYIPRGLVVTPDSKNLYVAQMGSNVVTRVALPEGKIVESIEVGTNPRHVVYDDQTLYLSINQSAHVVKYDLNQKKITARVSTRPQPRTIVLSPDRQVLFVSCYTGNALQAFRTTDLKLLGTWTSQHHPVAVDVYQQDGKYEVWVGNYSSGTLNVYDLAAITVPTDADMGGGENVKSED